MPTDSRILLYDLTTFVGTVQVLVGAETHHIHKVVSADSTDNVAGRVITASPTMYMPAQTMRIVYDPESGEDGRGDVATLDREAVAVLAQQKLLLEEIRDMLLEHLSA